MIDRIRMARKRLMVARERAAKAEQQQIQAKVEYLRLPEEAQTDEVWISMRAMHKATANDIFASRTLRAIERRKDRIA